MTANNQLEEYSHPFFQMTRPEDKLLGFGRTWEYGGVYHFGEPPCKRKTRVLRHIYQKTLPRVYYEKLSPKEFCQSTKGKRDALFSLLESFGSFQIEKP